jgi:hypothetical protein
MVILLSACSTTKSPVIPENEQVDSLSPVGVAVNENRSIIAAYNAVINPENNTFTIEPTSRESSYHFAITNLYPNVIAITDYGFSPGFWADIRLDHPFPDSGIDGFDPRIIAILPANPGVSFYYPIFNCIGNNSVVINPDGYTKLFDESGGSILGNTNPFKAYFKNQDHRIWASTGVTSETQRWDMNLSGFGGPMAFKLVVDVSSNYPSPPQPIIDNAPEQVQIDVNIGNGLTNLGGSAPIDVKFLDWQGQSDIKCKIESPDLFNGAIQLFYSGPGPNPDEYIFSGTIPNELLAPAGEHNILIASWDIPAEIHVFYEATAIVDEEMAFNPIDITPPLQSHPSNNLYLTENYLYSVERYSSSSPAFPKHLYLLDYQPIETTNYIGNVEFSIYPWDETSADVYTFDASDNLLCILYYCPWMAPHYWFEIRDINGNLLNVLGYYGEAWWDSTMSFCVKDGYAYVADLEFKILDIDPPDSAHIAKRITIPGDPSFVDVSGEYAFVITRRNSVIQIIDIEPVDSASIIKSVDTSQSWPLKVHAEGGYAFVAGSESSFQIIDIDPIEDAHVIKLLDMPGSIKDFDISNGYAFCAMGDLGIEIVNIDPPEAAHRILSFDTSGLANDVEIYENYAFVADGDDGLRIIELY